MWAVGRLSLLSRGFGRVKTGAAGPGPLRVSDRADVIAPRASNARAESVSAHPNERSINVNVPESPRSRTAEPGPRPETALPNLFHRVITKVKGFLRSVFG